MSTAVRFPGVAAALALLLIPTPGMGAGIGARRLLAHLRYGAAASFRRSSRR